MGKPIVWVFADTGCHGRRHKGHVVPSGIEPRTLCSACKAGLTTTTLWKHTSCLNLIIISDMKWHKIKVDHINSFFYYFNLVLCWCSLLKLCSLWSRIISKNAWLKTSGSHRCQLNKREALLWATLWKLSSNTKNFNGPRPGVSPNNVSKTLFCNVYGQG